MLINEICPFLGVCIERLEGKFTVGQQTLIKMELIHNRLSPKNIHTSIRHILSLNYISCQIESLSEILVWIALGKVYLLNENVGTMVKCNHSVPPILRQ